MLNRKRCDLNATLVERLGKGRARRSRLSEIVEGRSEEANASE
jgi:hypothetical protein